MAKQLRVISDDDWEILKRLVESNRNLLQSPITRPTANGQYLDGDDSMAPEVYIALPPADGIPGLDSVATGTGSDNPPTEGDRPGHASCNLYRIIDGELKLMSGISRTVYNLSESTIPQDWILVQRDKAGKWIAVVGGSSGTANIIRFRIVSANNCGTCTATAKVISVMAGGSTVPEEDHYGQVTIIDRVGCVLNEPAVTALVGRKGYAAYMTSREEGPCPGLPETGWEIISMCDEESMCA